MPLESDETIYKNQISLYVELYRLRESALELSKKIPKEEDGCNFDHLQSKMRDLLIEIFQQEHNVLLLLRTLQGKAQPKATSSSGGTTGD